MHKMSARLLGCSSRAFHVNRLGALGAASSDGPAPSAGLRRRPGPGLPIPFAEPTNEARVRNRRGRLVLPGCSYACVFHRLHDMARPLDVSILHPPNGWGHSAERRERRVPRHALLDKPAVAPGTRPWASGSWRGPGRSSISLRFFVKALPASELMEPGGSGPVRSRASWRARSPGRPRSARWPESSCSRPYRGR
jgi:hypothetical protein